ncbi:PAS-domain containing protein [Caenispirillum salinarum]|uniref:PAS-domain containing protein n=1 Tax=Caenispirillum salinarum TaxID=859058 RepID=UPI00384F600A
MSPRDGARTPFTRLAAGSRLRCDAQTLQALIDNLPSGVTFFGANLELIACNDRFRTLLDLPESLFVDGMPTLVTLARHLAARGEYGDGDPEIQVHEMVERYREMRPHVYERTRPDGTVLEVRGAPLAQGGFVTTYTDITDRKRAEEEAKRYASYLGAVLDSMPHGISVIDERLRIIFANTRIGEILDLPPGAFRPGDPFESVIRHNAERGEYGPGDTEAQIMRRIGLALKFEPHHFERTRPNGHVLEVQGTPVDMDGRKVGFVTTYTDITERKRAEEEVRRARDLMTEAINASAAFVWELDASGRYTYSLGAEKLLGYTDAEMVGRRFGTFHEDCADRSTAGDPSAGTHDAIARGEPFKNVTICLRRKDGATVYLSSSGHPIAGGDGHPSGYRGVDVDVTELTEARMQLERQALHDPLTGLANRHKFLERFTLECERQRRWNSPLSLLVIDVDHFKRVNDRHGHLVGDVVLKRVAARLDGTVRRTDLVARFGGEEFIVLLPETDAEGAAALAESLRTRIRAEPVRAEAGGAAVSVTVTVSIGAATMTAQRPQSFDDLMERADRAVYRAKHGGRDRVECAAATPAG